MAAPDRSSPTDAVALLEARQVGFGYAREAVLRDVSFRLTAGEFVALVGPNGSGKSTLLKVLLGALDPDEGEALLFGERPSRVKERWRVGYVPQRPVAASEVPATVREIVEAGRLALRGWWRPPASADRIAVEHAIQSVGLADMASRQISELSGGQQQRAFIARAFASEPDLLVLDEPIAGVDAESQRRFRDSLTHLISDHGAGVLLVSHELSAVADEIDRVIVLKGSVLFDGPPGDLMREGVSLGIHREDLPLWLEGLG